MRRLAAYLMIGKGDEDEDEDFLGRISSNNKYLLPLEKGREWI